MNHNTNLERAKEISCTSILSSSGYNGVAIGHKTVFYAPWRNESNRSLVVYPNNRWVDYGEGIKTKDAVDLYCRIYGVKTSEAIRGMLGKEYVIAEEHTQEIEPGVIICKVEDLEDEGLLSYIVEDRKICLEVAYKYCKQITIRFPKSKYPNRERLAIGFKNDMDGWELRNKFIKISNSPKCFTRIKVGSNRCITFEGFIDFLSYLTMKEISVPEEDVFVYNSTSFLEKSIPILKPYDIVHLYTDNDDAGDMVTDVLKNSRVWVKDMSFMYRMYNDLNDYLVRK